ncbi:MAG: zinc ABC transporter solute-binding protein [bacterium]|nr:zinc ABC transporter solute-binding protein [bacterium]
MILLALLITTGGCGEQNQRSGQDKPQVFVSIPPLEYFTKRIAAQHLTVSVLIAPGGNPHTFTPTPKQIVKLSRGGLLLCAGSDFEQTLSSKLRWDDQLKVVNLAGRSDNHDHDSDIHTWMSPRIAKTLAEKICVELCNLDPANSEDYRRNLRELQDDLDTLDATVTKTLKGLKGKTFFVFHPALGHFAEAYGLKQRAIEREGKAPGPKYRSELIASARAIGAKALFVQPQFSRRSADIIAKEIGCPVVVLDPLSGDYINNLEHIAEELQKALQP